MQEVTSLESRHPIIAFIGFGEAAKAFVDGFRQGSVDLPFRAFDIKELGSHAHELHNEYGNRGVSRAETSSVACAGADLIFSLVTPDQAELAAEAAGHAPLNGALFLDCNSCAPMAKERSAPLIEAAGGRYVDVAIMSPVHPNLHRSPCLLSGPHAVAACEVLSELDMAPKIAEGPVGAASTRKMIRSVMIKGLEALTLECFLAARKAGIEDEILASLDASFPEFEWPTRAPYMIERALTHGTRRAGEMREVAQTLRDLGIEPSMTEGTVTWQSEAGSVGLKAKELGLADLADLSDALLAAMDSRQRN